MHLIAQGPAPEDRWRRELPPGKTLTLGRAAGVWSAAWDDRISRQHASITLVDARLRVEQVAGARNPLFLKGRPAVEFTIGPGEHFVIGQTAFTLLDDRVDVSLDVPQPAQQQSFSAQYLRRLQFRDADQRIEILSRLPEVISSAANDVDLFARVVNMLLAGVPRATAAALVAVDVPAASESKIRVLHWDRRLAAAGDFVPSERLIRQSVTSGESRLHLWNAPAAEQNFTLDGNLDWAVCTPLHSSACRGWALYLAGRFAAPTSPTDAPSDPADLRDDLKFAELAASTLGSIREVQVLSRRQASLSQFFSPVVLEALASGDPEKVLAPRETEVSVLFCDLRGFSRRSERSSDDLLGLLERVSKALGVMSRHILDHGGVVGDFQGDAAMGFWGWPLPGEDNVRRACLAALAIRRQFESAASLPNHPLADFRMGIGIATGRAVAGKIGTADQVKVTVFGPVVNLASRLESMTKLLRAPILLDEPTAAVVRRLPADLARCRRLAVVKPYGMETPVEVTELLPAEVDFPLLNAQHLLDYETAVTAIGDGRWTEAFERLHRIPAEDRAKDFLTVFIAQHHRQPPPNWNGVISLASKE